MTFETQLAVCDTADRKPGYSIKQQDGIKCVTNDDKMNESMWPGHAPDIMSTMTQRPMT